MRRPGHRVAGLKIRAGRAIAAAAGLVPLFHLALLPIKLGAADAATQPAAPAAEDLKAIRASFADLANADPVVRSDAMVKLMGLKADELPQLKAVVQENRPLLPAQACVLEQIVTQVFLSGDPYESDPTQGFLGIKMETVQVTFHDALANEVHEHTLGVVVTDRMPGFPAARMLQDGDLILSILDHSEVSIQDARAFAAIVKDMGAGATVHFLILRHGQIIRVAVKLDPRPSSADLGVDNLLGLRRERANKYWEAEFAPLVKENVS